MPSAVRGPLERFAAPFRFERAVAANIAVKACSEVFVKAARLLLVVATARLLGPEEFGLFSFAFSVGSVLAVTADLGLHLQLAREVAVGERSPSSSLADAVSGKLLASGAVLCGIAATALLYPRSTSVRWLLVLACAYLLAQSWCELWNHFFRGAQSLGREAALNALNAALSGVLGIAVLAAGGGAHTLYVVLFVSAVATSGVALALVRRHRADPWPASAAAGIAALRYACPTGLAILLTMVYFRIDLVFLERMRGDAEVGAYAAAYRLLESFFFIPAFFMAALYPAFSSASRRAEDVRRLRSVGLHWMFLLSTLLVIGLTVSAPWALRLLYGDAYAEAATLLRVLAPALLFVFPNFVLTHLLVATGRQRWNALIAAVGVVVNVTLNLLAIRRFGAVGASAVTVITEATLFILAAWAVSREAADRTAVA
jgi:O-antigen/teichoic acid export membrane protein